MQKKENLKNVPPGNNFDVLFVNSYQASLSPTSYIFRCSYSFFRPYGIHVVTKYKEKKN
jgi:ABC-type Fe3+ transport system substrate-binding protein